jgi:hypothetical protein
LRLSEEKLIYVCAGIYQKDLPGKINMQHHMDVVTAENDDEALGKFISRMAEVYQDRAQFMRPLFMSLEEIEKRAAKQLLQPD